MNASSPYILVTSLISFFLSMGAAALAVNLYALLRTGRVGASWRVLIIASVMFALLQAVRLAEVFNVPMAADLHLSSIIELAFVVTLLYAFYLQRRVFTGEARANLHRNSVQDDEDDDDSVLSTYERYS